MRRIASFVSLAVLVVATAALTGAAPVAAAGVTGPPVYGTRTTTIPIAGTSSFFDQGPFRCPAGSVITGVVAEQNNIYSWLTGVQIVCSSVDVSEGTVQLGTPTRGDGVLGAQSDYSDVPSTCPSGSVVTGFASGRTGTLVDAVQVRCAALGSDGSIGVTSLGAVAGGSGGNPRAPALCPTGAVATGVFGNTGDDLDSIAFECQSLTFQQTVADNGAWPTARLLNPNDDVDDALVQSGEQLWYKVPVQPGSRVQVDLTNLPADYDLAVFKDIGQAFDTLTSTADLTKLSAEFAGDAFSPSVFTPSVFTPSVFTPSVFTPSVFTPSVFTPSVFTPSVFTPSVFTPSVFTPSVFTPSVFTPANFDPSVSPANAFTPFALPAGLTQSKIADAFASAQTRSLLAVSANDGTAPETVSQATWNNTGFFYLRVTGRNGSFSPQAFHLRVRTTGGPCSGITLDSHSGDATIVGSSGPQTLILTDPSRLPGSAADKSALAGRLDALATATNGVVVDVSGSPKVAALNAQADGPASSCPYAKNLVAQAIRDIVNSYRGHLKYVVLVGGDHAIPFFRYADAAGLGPESNYVPPVLDASASQASLRTNNILSQDAYGAASDISIKGSTLPIPDLAVGRLVETPAEISANITRYLAAPTLSPQSSLVTGYDFLTDGADAVERDLSASVANNSTLITDADVAPAVTTVGGVPDRRHSWTATDLAHALLGARHDITFLAGHFSANNTLAADYSSTLDTSQLATAPAGNFAGTLVFSAGCHSGYNIVDSDGVPGVTDGLDWAQALAQQGATLVAGTGYQYGDTDFVKYGEKLYSLFAHDLRYGTGAVSVGQTLVEAKNDYLAGLVSVTGIDQKTLLESTLFGLPMQGVNLLSGRLPEPGTDQSAVSPTDVGSQPGSTLGLRVADLRVTPSLTSHTQTLTSSAGGTVDATYLSGPDGVVNNPGEPAVPLQTVNVTSPDGQVLRGVGFRSGTYQDSDGITPLVGVATTEQSGAHTPFSSPTWFPNRIATPNYFDALSSAGGGTTRLAVTPVQHRSDSSADGTDTQRRYQDLGFRLYYSDNTTTYGNGNQPARAAAPSITGVSSSIIGGTLHLETHVVGDPSAGIQGVWVTYTSESGSWHGTWSSLDLTQNATDSTLWSGDLTLPSDVDPGAVRFLVQGVNGVGLVGVDDNQGFYYAPAVVPGVTVDQQSPTQLTLGPAAASVAYGASTPVTATLVDADGRPVAGRPVTFGLGGASVTAVTDANGVAATALPASVSPGAYPLSAGFAGDATYAVASSSANPTVQVTRAPTSLVVGPGATPAAAATATLSSGGAPLRQKTVVFVVRKASSGALSTVRAAITDGNGVASLGADALPSGGYTVTTLFGSATTPLPGGTTTDLSDPVYASASSGLLKVTTALTPLLPTVIAKAYTTAVPVPSAAAATATGLPAGLALARAGNGSWTITGTTPRTAGWYTIAITSKNGAAPASTAYYLLVIGYATSAFAAPVNDPPGSAASVFPASSTVPLRIKLTDAAGTPIPAAEAAAIAAQGRASVVVVRVGSTSAKANETKVAPVAQSGSTFSYDSASGQFVYYANAAPFNWVAGRTYLLSIVVVAGPGQVIALRAVPVGFAKG